MIAGEIPVLSVGETQSTSDCVVVMIAFNPLTPAAVSKPLEVIGSPTYVLACH